MYLTGWDDLQIQDVLLSSPCITQGGGKNCILSPFVQHDSWNLKVLNLNRSCYMHTDHHIQYDFLQFLNFEYKHTNSHSCILGSTALLCHLSFFPVFAGIGRINIKYSLRRSCCYWWQIELWPRRNPSSCIHVSWSIELALVFSPEYLCQQHILKLHLKWLFNKPLTKCVRSWFLIKPCSRVWPFQILYLKLM